MIHATFFRKANQLIGCEFNGHAEYAQSGQDIVCSAVSALSQTAILGMTEIAKVPTDWNISDSGKLTCRAQNGITPQQAEKTALLMDTLKVGVESIAKAYPGYLKISIKEV